MMHGVDPDDPTKYKRLAESLRAKIIDGALAEGDVVSLAKLAEETRWSRQTCARALQILEAERFLVRYPGLGYRVAGRERWQAHARHACWTVPAPTL